MIRRVVLVACLAALPAQAGTVFVTVSGVRNTHGHVRVAVCSKSDFLKPQCPYRGKAPAAVGRVVVVIPNVPPGTYAAQAFHDENDNGKIDSTLLGLPEEGLGFSNNAKMFFGPPRFSDASFAVGGTVLNITFSILYY